MVCLPQQQEHLNDEDYIQSGGAVHARTKSIASKTCQQRLRQRRLTMTFNILNECMFLFFYTNFLMTRIKQ